MTTKIGYGVFSGSKLDYDEEAIVVIWNEKNILKVSGLNPGHGAMKLKRREFDDSSAKMTIVEYVSWWPTAAAGKKTKKDVGKRSTAYSEDKGSEISPVIQMLLFLSAMWTEMSDMPEEAYEILKHVWTSCRDSDDTEETEFIESFKKLGIEDNFANFGKIANKYSMRGNQQILSSQKSKFDLMKTRVGRMRDKKKTPDTLGIGDYAELSGMAGASYFGKLPDAKVYLPCSSWVLNSTGTKRNCTVWGLSLQSMYISWLCFHADGKAQYEMKSQVINCAGVVMVRLQDGFGDAFVKWPKAMGIVRSIRKMVSYVPSDLTKVGTAMDKEFKKLNTQQSTLDKMIVEHKKAVVGAHTSLRAKKLFWRHLLELANWKTASASSAARWSDIGGVDKALKKYEAANNALSPKEEKRIIQAIMDDMAKLTWFKKVVSDLSEKADAYEKKMALQKNLWVD